MVEFGWAEKKRKGDRLIATVYSTLMTTPAGYGFKFLINLSPFLILKDLE